MAVLEEHIIKIRHVSDAKELAKVRAEAVKAAQEIAAAFQRAETESEDAAEEIADDQEKAAKKTSEVWTGALRQVGARITDFGLASAGMAARYIADTFESIRVTDQFSKTLGVSSSEMLALEKGFERARVPADNTREAIKTLRENLGELDRVGTGPALDSLGSLGLTLEDFKSQTPTEQLKTFADALKNIDDPMKRTSIAIELMGEDGQRLMPAMLDGAEGIDALAKAARDAGQVLDDETIQATRDLDDAIMDAKASAEGIALSILERAMPALQGAAGDMATWTDENQELIDQGVPIVIDAIATSASAAATAVLTVARAMKAMREEVQSAKDWIRKNPLGGNPTFTEDEKRATRLARKRRMSAATPGDYVPVRRAETAPGVFSDVEAGPDVGGLGASTASIDAAEAARLDTQRRIEKQNQRTLAAKFERGEKSTSSRGGGGGGRKTDRDEMDREMVAAFAEANSDLVAELTRLGGRFGATEQGLFQTQLSAAQSINKGGNVAAARKAGLGTLGRVTDTANIDRQVSQDPLSQLFGIEALPDVSPGDISQDRAPDVLTATINNTFTIEQNFAIDGAARPDLIPDQITDAFRSLFANEVERQSNYVKVPFAR